MIRKLVPIAAAVALAVAVTIAPAGTVSFGTPSQTDILRHDAIWCTICMQWERIERVVQRQASRTCIEEIRFVDVNSTRAFDPGDRIAHVDRQCTSTIPDRVRSIERRKPTLRR